MPYSSGVKNLKKKCNKTMKIFMYKGKKWQIDRYLRKKCALSKFAVFERCEKFVTNKDYWRND